jgi:hypothetical protein
MEKMSLNLSSRRKKKQKKNVQMKSFLMIPFPVFNDMEREKVRNEMNMKSTRLMKMNAWGMKAEMFENV